MCAAETFGKVTEATHCPFVTIFTENCDITGIQMQKVISRWKPEEEVSSGHSPPCSGESNWSPGCHYESASLPSGSPFRGRCSKIKDKLGELIWTWQCQTLPQPFICVSNNNKGLQNCLCFVHRIRTILRSWIQKLHQFLSGQVFMLLKSSFLAKLITFLLNSQ